MLDIDYFKRYNDTYGHQAGDDCLTRVARVLKQSVRTPDDVVSRYGGEEFVVILFNCPENIAEKVALRIQDGLRAEAIPHGASTVSDHVTVSMGIAGMAGTRGHRDYRPRRCGAVSGERGRAGSVVAVDKSRVALRLPGLRFESL
jgi:diguanylate cyclase (GGDEF)-like protein